MKGKLKEPLIICSGIFIIIALVSGALLTYRLNRTSGSLPTTEEVAEPDEEESFQYELTENSTDYQIDMFNELVSVCKSYQQYKSEENLELYASALVKNFVADFYTWSNKEGRNDVGGVQFMSSEIQTTFKTNAIDDFYLYLNQYLEMYDPDDLLTVTNVIILDIETGIEIEEIDDSLDDDNGFEMNELTGDDDLETDESEDDELDLEADEEEDTRSFIRVNAMWEYEDSYLTRMGTFQQGANFILVEEEGLVSIHAIEALE